MCDCKFTGQRTCHCAVCHQTFASPHSFDRHQRLFLPYGMVCLAPELIVRKDGSRVLRQGKDGYWREYRPDLGEVKERFRRDRQAA